MCHTINETQQRQREHEGTSLPNSGTTLVMPCQPTWNSSLPKKHLHQATAATNRAIKQQKDREEAEKQESEQSAIEAYQEEKETYFHKYGETMYRSRYGETLPPQQPTLAAPWERDMMMDEEQLEDEEFDEL